MGCCIWLKQDKKEVMRHLGWNNWRSEKSNDGNIIVFGTSTYRVQNKRVLGSSKNSSKLAQGSGNGFGYTKHTQEE